MILVTCVLLWLASGDHRKLSEGTLARINAAAIVSVVAITGFEIGIKHASGKLILPAEPREWLNTVLEYHHIETINLDADICIRSTELPPLHQDPCDRLIIAAALINHLPVVTTDRHFAKYGVKVLN